MDDPRSDTESCSGWLLNSHQACTCTLLCSNTHTQTHTHTHTQTHTHTHVQKHTHIHRSTHTHTHHVMYGWMGCVCKECYAGLFQTVYRCQSMWLEGWTAAVNQLQWYYTTRSHFINVSWVSLCYCWRRCNSIHKVWLHLSYIWSTFTSDKTHKIKPSYLFW